LICPHLPFTFDEEIERMLEDENSHKEESYKRGSEEGIA